MLDDAPELPVLTTLTPAAALIPPTDPALARKLGILADAAKYDASCASSGAKRARPAGGMGDATGMGICHSYTPDGRCVSLLKLLLTNHCTYDCRYCVNRVSSDTERARFTVAEVVELTLAFYRRNYIEGLFLSSGILRTPDETMAQLTLVARTLRETHAFGGYIHLKAAPGVSDDALFDAGRWADRLSVNVELPTQAGLDQLAPAKSLVAVERTMTTIATGVATAKSERRNGRGFRVGRFAPAGQSTQMVIGATADSDAVIMHKASELYGRHGLRRVYYSAFSPIPHADPSLPPKAPPLLREHRLYQADWLLRFYGFSAQEIVGDDGNLALEHDPKLAWALRHRALFPLDVNRAARELLLRVPGLGVRNVDRILRLRRQRAVTLADLGRLKVPLKKARPFLIAADHLPLHLDRLDLGQRLAQSVQLELFDSRTGALTGQI